MGYGIATVGRTRSDRAVLVKNGRFVPLRYWGEERLLRP